MGAFEWATLVLLVLVFVFISLVWQSDMFHRKSRYARKAADSRKKARQYEREVMEIEGALDAISDRKASETEKNQRKGDYNSAIGVTERRREAVVEENRALPAP